MSMNKPSEAEDEYFTREEAARKQRQAIEQARQMEAAALEALKQLHFMKCPKCGFDLHETLFRGVRIDKCYHCGGTFFDPGELEKLAGHEEHNNLFQNIVRLFRVHRPG